MLIRIDPTSTQPLFEQLAASIRAQVVSGVLVSGERLPAARALADGLAINVHTVLRAYQILRDEGLLELRRRSGAVITDRAEAYAELARAIPALVSEAKRLELGPAALTALIKEAY